MKAIPKDQAAPPGHAWQRPVAFVVCGQLLDQHQRPVLSVPATPNKPFLGFQRLAPTIECRHYSKRRMASGLNQLIQKG
jgi:hypothetical protein